MGGVRRGGALWVLWLALCAGGCSARVESHAAGTVLGSWQYRWGDSPRGAAPQG